MRAKPIPLAVRRAVWARSGGICELGCGRRAIHTHHRRMRSQAGRHEPVNLLHVCGPHHEFIHANPRVAYARGWLVRSGFEPADVPVSTGDVT